MSTFPSASPSSSPVTTVVNIGGAQQPAAPTKEITPVQDLGSSQPLALHAITDFSLSQSDLVDIGVAQIEKQIRTQLADVTDSVNLMKTTLEQINKAISKFLTEWTRQQADADVRINPFITAFKAFDSRGLTIQYSEASYSTSTNKISADVTLSGSGISYEIEYASDAPISFMNQLEQRKNLQSQIAEGERNQLRLRNAMQSMDVVERQVRAGIATANIKKAGEHGEALLASVLAAVDAGTMGDKNSLTRLLASGT
jgi:fibrillarin-like rRNA methylase